MKRLIMTAALLALSGAAAAFDLQGVSARRLPAAAAPAPEVPLPAPAAQRPQPCEEAALRAIESAGREMDPLDPALAFPAADRVEAAVKACPAGRVKLAAVAALRRGLSDRFEPTATIALKLPYICAGDRACAVAAIEAQGWLITWTRSPLAVEWSVYNLWLGSRYPEVKAAAEAALKWKHPL